MKKLKLSSYEYATQQGKTTSLLLLFTVKILKYVCMFEIKIRQSCYLKKSQVAKPIITTRLQVELILSIKCCDSQNLKAPTLCWSLAFIYNTSHLTFLAFIVFKTLKDSTVEICERSCKRAMLCYAVPLKWCEEDIF